MFRGNKPVLILPGILMIVMFIGGYTFLHKSETMTNEQLQRAVDIDVETFSREDGLQIEINWDWTTMPSDGVSGDDYLGVALIDKTSNEARTNLDFTDATLQLIHGGEVIKEVEGRQVENGLIFAFPNKMIDYTSYGNVGAASVIVKGEELDQELVRVQLLHTWTEHGGLKQEDALFKAPSFQDGTTVPYWIISR